MVIESKTWWPPPILHTETKQKALSLQNEECKGLFLILRILRFGQVNMREKEMVIGKERWKEEGKDSNIYVWDKWYKNIQVITVILWLAWNCTIPW